MGVRGNILGQVSEIGSLRVLGLQRSREIQTHCIKLNSSVTKVQRNQLQMNTDIAMLFILVNCRHL